MRTQGVMLLRSGNRLVVDPTTPEIADLLGRELSYVEKIFFRGWEAREREERGLPRVEEKLWEVFGRDHKDRIAFPYGFRERVERVLQQNGYEPKLMWAFRSERDRVRELRETVYKPDWGRIDELVKSGFEFRAGQREALEILVSNENGRIDCPPGWGKGTLIMLAATALPQAKIDVVTKSVAVITQRLYPELCMNLPSVGVAVGSKHKLNRRVMCVSVDSYRYFRENADIVFVDEGHQCCADAAAERLGAYDRARMFAFSGSWDMRLDNKDLRGEAMFGPIRLSVSYQEAQAAGMVVPIEVVWGDVIMDVNPCADAKDVWKKKLGIWTNDYRNRQIAKDARLYDRDTQVLITCETLEHALHLKRFLPEFKVVYSSQDRGDEDWRRFHRDGLIPDGWRDMTEERKQRLTRMFETGQLKKVIVTTVWNVGVNFKKLQVLIRADGGASPVNDIQIPGRTSRVGEKAVGIVHDYRDQFDQGFRQRAAAREARYKKNGWAQHHPRKDRQSYLRQLMGWSAK